MHEKTCKTTSSSVVGSAVRISLHHRQCAGLDRRAEITLKRVAEPDPELLENGAIQAECLAHALGILVGRGRRQHHRQRIGREQPQHHERDDRDRQELKRHRRRIAQQREHEAHRRVNRSDRDDRERMIHRGSRRGTKIAEHGQR